VLRKGDVSVAVAQKILDQSLQQPEQQGMDANATADEVQPPQKEHNSENDNDGHFDSSPEKKSPLTDLEVAPSRTYHIFQFSTSGVASTLTVNLLTGLFEGAEQGVSYLECKGDRRPCNWQQGLNYRKKGFPPSSMINRTIVTKTHATDVEELQEMFTDDFDQIFFVGNERKDQNKFLPQEYCSNQTFPNVLCLEYNDLQYEDKKGLKRVVEYVSRRIQTDFPYFAGVSLKEGEAVQRLLDMAEAYKEGSKGLKISRYGLGGGNAINHTLNDESGVTN